jgi:hypothetical protein
MKVDIIDSPSPDPERKGPPGLGPAIGRTQDFNMFPGNSPEGTGEDRD